MPFTPKFVDLVRNLTVTQGTGPVALGAAVAGYTSLAAAIAPGEQFYYCLQGVDKPAEHEVGRGTMQANGTVAREAVSGSLTNFTNGTKTIALVAAAEWFSRLNDAGSGAPAFELPTRAALAAARTARPAYLSEAGREGLFKFASGNQSALVAADGAQGMCIAPASDPSGASGAWRRVQDGPLKLEWFGAVPGDYVSGIGVDCLPAWNALNAYLDAVDRNVSLAAQGAGPQILFSGNHYYFSETLQIKRTLRLTGMGSGLSGGEPTWLRFPANQAGIVVNRYNTLGDAEQNPATTGGDGTIIEGFLLHSAGGTLNGDQTIDLLYSGIRLRARALIRDCIIRNFRGAGVCISAAAADPVNTPFYGNANNWRLDTVRVERNRTGGLFVSGGDANAGIAIGVDASANGRFGLFDGAFLGNAYIGCHADANGLPTAVAGIPIGTVSHGGNRYFLRLGVSKATAQATTPGTNDAVWRYFYAGGPSADYPAWSASGDYAPSGAYGQSGSANKTQFDSCYAESGQAPPQIMGAAIVNGGFMFDGQADGAPHLQGAAGIGLTSQLGFGQSNTFADGSFAHHRLGGSMSGSALDLLTWNSSVAFPSDPGRKSSLVHDKASGDLIWNSYGVSSPFRLTGYSTARTYGGRSAADCRYTVEAKELALGNGDAGRVITVGSGAPTGGSHAKGEIIFNNGSAVSLDTVLFWYCQVTGTPGQWAVFAPRSASEPIGYQVGAGGSNAQGASKSESVTVHKACGRVTMSAASLAAGAAVSFTLISNLIAASDTVIVNIASGASADSYEVCVTAVGLTTARIQLRNISGAALGEAVVLNFAVVKAVNA